MIGVVVNIVITVRNIATLNKYFDEICFEIFNSFIITFVEIR